MADNVVTLGGKPAGISAQAAGELRDVIEKAIASAAHVLVVVTSPSGDKTHRLAFTCHAEATNVPLATFYRDAYVVAHQLLVDGEEDYV